MDEDQATFRFSITFVTLTIIIDYYRSIQRRICPHNIMPFCIDFKPLGALENLRGWLIMIHNPRKGNFEVHSPATHCRTIQAFEV